MKKYILIVFLLHSMNVLAQTKAGSFSASAPGSVIKLDITFGGLQYEFKTGEHNSINLGVLYSFAGLANHDKFDFQITPEYRYYFSQKSGWPSGFYLAEYLFYKDYMVTRDQGSGYSVFSRDHVKTAGMGLKPGYQFVFADRFSFDFGLGFGYNLYRSVEHQVGFAIIDEASHNFNFTGGLTIGYIF